MREMANKKTVTDREKLQFAIRATASWEFGSLCDSIDTLTDISTADRESIKVKIRTRGNNIIRVCSNHLEAYNVTRKNTEVVNPVKIATRIQEEG